VHALPLIAHDRPGRVIDLRGTLNLYSGEREYFDAITVDHYASLASCLTHAIRAFRGHLAEDLTSGVKSLRASERRKRAEEALQKAQAELASASRLTMMAQVAASIAHEIKQPLAAIVTNVSAASRWLAKKPPDLRGGRARVLTMRSAVRDSKSALITVEDTGTGIEPNNIQRIFESFFTTKRHGMGMGLVICRSIIDSHGGSLLVSQQHPHGTVFQVILPSIADEVIE
jgi:C4-dicarboxylate-specific signal transduction histidine kinase